MLREALLADPRGMRSWLVESYWPPHAGSPDAAAGRIHAAAARHAVRLAGVVHVPGDEMALWRFEGIDRTAIQAACQDAEVSFERIVEVVDVAALAESTAKAGAAGSVDPGRPEDPT